HHEKSDTNPILSSMRDSFRTYVTHPDPHAILDIGCGPGMDVAFFAEKYPRAKVYGIDVSEGMIDYAAGLCKAKNLSNTEFINTGIENLQQHLQEDLKFDVIYVFFGALNTVSSLEKAASAIDSLLNPGGQAVLTFVNKYYLSEFVVNMLKLRPGKATARWGNIWRGYSNDYALASKTYTPTQIQKAFSNTSLKLQKRRGYSIFYPAWFQAGKLKKYPGLCRMLYSMDKLSNNTLLWSKGEYTLFVYTKALSQETETALG
ncbi:MAG TPA: class I SAM-dependent methyltransferase, partial [Flavipsychrobacter sp.]